MKLFKKLETIPVDKLLHFISGILIMSVAWKFFPDPLYAIGVVMVVAVLKEVADRRMDVPDIMVTIFGGIVQFLLVKLILS